MATEVTEIHCKTEIEVLGGSFFWWGKKCDLCVCVSQPSPLFGGRPQEAPPPFCVFPDRRTGIWSPHEPQAPERETHFLRRASANVCTPSKHFCAAAPLHISHTLPCSQPPPTPHPCMTAKHLPHLPPHPPTPCSSHHPLTWLQTNKNLRRPVILYLVSVGGGFPCVE